MLAFGFKVAWFTLSLLGFLSNLLAFPAFAEALDGYIIPSLYTGSNFVLQGIFCLGMIWKMDPLAMPRAFCTVQPAIFTVAWLFTTFVTSGMAVCSTSAILRPKGGVPATPMFVHSFGHTVDHFTPVPLRRQSRTKANSVYHEAKTFDPSLWSAEASPISTGLPADQRSTTPSGIIVEAIPSPPDSLSSGRVRVIAGRAPAIRRHDLRYHLPFQWRFNEPLNSADGFRSSPDSSLKLSLSDSRHTPSPLIFANPVEERNQYTTTVAVVSDPSERLYEAAPWLKDEKVLLRQMEKVNRSLARHHCPWNTSKGFIHDDDEDYDAVSRELRWARHSSGSISSAKSELEFARRPPGDNFEEGVRRPSPAELSTYDAALTETPIPDFTSMVWRILFFQLLSSATQIVATFSSLVDMSKQHALPAPFGTQHVALLLTAWMPLIAFGVRWPWWWRERVL
ncbi:hypothetical protein GSI_10747 [Ganoderma sinense ZZ0214-1]|uniref:Transporter n=1 Tax=Ganoderma sinense ZZ0214-1 TaxID=1077348 RepID=A0A2G8S1F0_9APHY|nr:hypothetical protein GSI_10747 [Ganoderma sinense ZZ0214-1]